MATLTYFFIKLNQTLTIWIKYFTFSGFSVLEKCELLLAVPGSIKVLQIRGRAAGEMKASVKTGSYRQKPLSRPCRIYYTGRQYNATIMIRIKFTPCASRNGACRRRRTLRFGIESNLGSNPFGCVLRECATRVHIRDVPRRLSV